MHKPDKWDRNYVQHFLATADMGPLALIGDDAMTWGSMTNPNGHARDLISLRPRRLDDSFSHWLASSVITSLFRCGCTRFKKPSKTHGVVGIQDSTIIRIASWVTSVLASVIPIVSIAVLYNVNSMKVRIGMVAVFNLVISLCMTVFTDAKRSEIFAVGAA